jgi:adenylate cyclase
VEVTAQLIESILSNNLLRRPAYLSRIEIALLVAVGLLIIFAFPYRHPRSSAGILTAMVLGLVGFEYASFRIWHLLFDAAYPALASIVMFAVMLGASLRAAEAAQRRLAEALAHERESKALIEGELNAARTIQMGLLPRPFAGFPQRPELDVYAVVEPAQIVGGDLYDFAMLDDSHFFFAIADVSGKGVPAALFMAMSKEVLRAATLNFGEHLDQVFAEANRRISAVSDEMAGAGADMMFVTVFAGVIDLATGNLVHLNAGHHAPFVREPDGAIKRLSGRGGPPLGSVDGFRYDVETYQMTAGEMLLLYTDGLTEAENAGGTFYGRERLEKLLAGNSLDGAESLVDLVRDDVRHFVDGAVQADDVTLMALKWQGAPSPI